jgi:hypothetical protein
MAHWADSDGSGMTALDLLLASVAIVVCCLCAAAGWAAWMIG